MKSSQDFYQLLNSLDKQKYGMYKQLKGCYDFGKFRLAVDHVQVDPYAPPSKMRIIMDRKTAGIPDDLLDSKSRRIAVADFLTRVFASNIAKQNKKSKGQGTNGKVFIDQCGQEILERTAVVIGAQEIEVRIEVGLPAEGGKFSERLRLLFSRTCCRRPWKHRYCIKTSIKRPWMSRSRSCSTRTTYWK